MGEANRLFRETDMNVSEAAVAVDYSNISHFSNAYKKHFGILPKKHLLRIKDVLCHHFVCLISIKKVYLMLESIFPVISACAIAIRRELEL